VVLCASPNTVREIMIKAHELNFDNGEYVFFNIDLFSSKNASETPWFRADDTEERNSKARKAYESLMTVTLRTPTSAEYRHFSNEVKARASEMFPNFTYGEDEVCGFDIVTVSRGEIYHLLHVWNFDLPIVCKIRLYLNATFVTSSSFLLVAIANTRYKMVCHPFDPPVSLTRATCTTILLFFVSLVTSLPYAIIQGSQTVNTTDKDISGCVCRFDDIYVEELWPTVNSVFTFLIFIVGSILIIVFYVNIGCKSWKQRATLIKVQQKCLTQTRKESDNDLSFSPDVNVESHDHLSIQRGESTTSDSSYNRQTDRMHEKPVLKTNFYLPNSLKKSKMTGDDTENGVGDSRNDVSSKTDLETKSGTNRQQYKASRLQELIASSSVGTSARSKLIQKRTYLLGRTSCMMLTVTLFFFFGFLPSLALNILMSVKPDTVASFAGVELAMHNLFLRWSTRVDAFSKGYCRIYAALEELQMTQSSKPLQGPKQCVFCKKCACLKLMAIIWNRIVERFQATSEEFQSYKVDIGTVINLKAVFLTMQQSLEVIFFTGRQAFKPADIGRSLTALA
ncbi:hypothetical protein Btru_051329, partial [Bulinus truncatus]